MRYLLKTQTDIEHTVECVRSMEKYDYDFSAFEEKYPNYCKTCEGARWDFSYSWDMGIEAEPCSNCTNQNICGLCGEEFIDSDDCICPNGCPEQKIVPFFECYCEMERKWKNQNDYNGI